MLDDLAENDPERYKNFIEQELKDGKKLCVDPEPQFCLQTKILVGRIGAMMICVQWNYSKIPYPSLVLL